MTKKQLARITGMASYLPEKILTNADLEKMVETSDEWITSRTGISERRIAASDEFTSDLGTKAATKLLNDMGIKADTIDAILVATTTPDYICPTASALIQANLKAGNAAAMDIMAACTGFIYALSVAKAYVESGMYRRVLLIAAEKLSTIVDYQDRNTCVLFGDGASAALIEAEGDGLEIESVKIGADGERASLIIVPGGGGKNPASLKTLENRDHFLKMEGKEVFKHAVRRMSQSVQEALLASKIAEDQISWIVPHQANARIMDAIGKNFGISDEKIYRTVHKYGNTSASSIGIALDELLATKSVDEGEVIVLTAFGAGLTYGAAVLKKVSTT